MLTVPVILMRVPVASCCLELVLGLLLLITCNPKSLKNPPPRLLFLALAGPFCVLGNLGKSEIRIEQRAGKMVLGILGVPPR